MTQAASLQVTNPGAISTFTHKAELRRWQTSSRFKQMKKDHAFIPGAVCAHCGRKHGEQRYDRHGNPRLTAGGKPSLTVLTINHMSETLYLTEDLYLTWDPALMEVCCTVCNGWDRQGKEVCPVCKVNPIKKDDPLKMCTACYLDAHPEIKIQVEESKERRKESRRQFNRLQSEKRKKMKVRHPCTYYGYRGQCRLSSIDAKCTFAQRKALKPVEQGGCNRAVAKKGKKQHGTGGARI